jgi:hypothetical protein
MKKPPIEHSMGGFFGMGESWAIFLAIKKG